MTTLKAIPSLVSAALLSCTAFAPSLVFSQDSRAAATPQTLQVQVVVPPTWQPLFEDRITEAFVSYLADVFRRQGYKGEIAEVRWAEEPSPGCCLLTINLTEWRMNHIGNIDCTFTASLQTENAIRHLGIFTGMSFRWMHGPSRFGLADAFEDAAEDALRDLYRTVAKTELVPGAHKG